MIVSEKIEELNQKYVPKYHILAPIWSGFAVKKFC